MMTTEDYDDHDDGTSRCQNYVTDTKEYLFKSSIIFTHV